MFKKNADWYFSRRALPYWGLLALDSFIVMFSGYLAKYLEAGGLTFAQHFWQITHGTLLSLMIFFLFFRIFHTYSGVVRYSSFVDLKRIAFATFLGSLITWGVSLCIQKHSILDFLDMPNIKGVLVMFAFTTLFMELLRIAVKSMFDATRKNDNSLKTVIYGVREGGVGLAKMIRNQSPQRYDLDGFISPDGEMVDNLLMGVRVRNSEIGLAARMKSAGVKVVLVSPIQVDKFRVDENLINELIENEIKIMMIPRPEEWDEKSEFNTIQLQEVEIEDLLPREKIEVDMDSIGALLHGKRILITGAAGSIGSEMVRQVAIFKPSEMVLIDQAETPMHDVRLLMNRQFGDIKSETIVGSISNQTFMESIFAEHRPEYVFHAAAYKHVPMMEDNPAMAVQKNIYGTRVIADLAVVWNQEICVSVQIPRLANSH